MAPATARRTMARFSWLSKTEARATSRRMSFPDAGLATMPIGPKVVAVGLASSADDALGLGDDAVGVRDVELFEGRREGHRGEWRPDAPDGCIEVIERLFLDLGGDFGAETA